MGFLHQSQRVFTPLSQSRLGNIDVVRLKRGGCRFEVACNKNKAEHWRSGVETNFEEVLQSKAIFENVSRGKRAHDENIQRVFGSLDVDEVAKIIIERGELQVADGDRTTQNESILEEIATIVAQKCVNPDSNRSYSSSSIERLMREVQYAPVPNRTAKQQALDIIPKLNAIIPIARAKMRIRIIASISDSGDLQVLFTSMGATVIDTHTDTTTNVICLIDPGTYRQLDSYVSENPSDRSLEVLDLAYHEEGEHSIDENLLTKIESVHITEPSVAPLIASSAPITAQEKSSGRACSTCGGNFSDTAQYRVHFKSEWHRYNLKMKAKQLAILDEDTFNELDPNEIDRVFNSLE